MYVARTCVLALGALCACSGSVDGLELVDSVESAGGIGEDDLVPVSTTGDNLPDKYRPLLDAFGRATNQCTVTHVGRGIAISAGHCFLPMATSARDAPCDVDVLWGLRGESDGALVSRCTSLHEAVFDTDADWAIFFVDPIPRAAVEPSLEERAPIGTTLTMFGHPFLQPLVWSQTCTLASGLAGGWGASQFSHACDSQPGSSGSALLDEATLKVVGIHGGGTGAWNYGTYLSDTSLGEALAEAAAQAR